MDAPRPGDRILVLRPHWLSLILSGEKTLEIRGRKLSAGWYWLGAWGMIHGRAFLTAATRITTAQAFRDLRVLHRIDMDELPYKKTYGLSITCCECMGPIPYVHPRGAAGIVKYR
jgi:hypothetical protein